MEILFVKPSIFGMGSIVSAYFWNRIFMAYTIHTGKYCQILRRYKRINPLLFIKTKKPHPKDAVFIYKIVFAISMQ